MANKNLSHLALPIICVKLNLPNTINLRVFFKKIGNIFLLLPKTFPMGPES